MNAQTSGMKVETAAQIGQISMDLKRAHDRTVEVIGALSNENAAITMPDTYKAALKLEKRIEQARGRCKTLLGVK